MIPSTWLGAATMAAMAALSSADTAHIYNMTDVESWQLEYEMVVDISVPSADIPLMSYTVVPLTTAIGLNRSAVVREAVSIPGNLVVATHTNYNNITGPSQIAYLCCDSLDNSFTDPDDMLKTLMANTPLAILLYSQEGNCCGLDATSLSYQTIFTMAYSLDAADALNYTSAGSSVVRATISGNVTSADQGDTTTNNTSNSAIAMSILYSITGLITALFLIIIATGAIRAHRYPDRYGPRSGHGGRPRQSRARGLARAVLETIPIVKFGDPTPAKPDLGTELESQASTEPGAETNGGDRGSDRDSDMTSSLAATNAQVHHLSAIPEDSVSQPKSVMGATTRAVAEPEQHATSIGPADATAAASSDTLSHGDNGHLGCSICTEDFNVGEDVRVLPCNHKFHPTCVDPWLVNVSGTCPLCRLDLRPKDGENDDRPSSEETHLPPPLEDDEAAAVAAESSNSGQHRQRSSRLFDLNRLRHASAEERIEALRRYRSENQTESSLTPSAAPANGDDEHSRSVRLTRRLRDRFHIRTHAQSSSG